jgi:glycosyltransferase involved in cell wall biosynthesis
MAIRGDLLVTRRRVLIIVENLPVPLDRRVWQEALALRAAGHDVTVICPRTKDYNRPHEVLDGVVIHRHRLAGEGSSLLGFAAEYASALWGEALAALRTWRRTGIDVIHLCNPPDLLFLVALPYKILGGVKVVYDVHDLCPEMFEAKFGRRPVLSALVRWAERCTLWLADAVLVTNASAASIIRRRGGKPEDAVFEVRTAPARMDTSRPPDPRLRNGRSFLVGYVGVMGSTDGVEYLLDAADHVVHHRHRTDVQFLLMGGGPEHGRLVSRRDALGLRDWVAMPGRVSDEFLSAALTTMDLGVACDPINGYNDLCTMNKTLEYMAFGKPQVMFGTVEGRRSAGDAAHYVLENCPRQLGDAVIEMLDDPEARARMGEAGRRRLLTELSWERSVAHLLAAYRHVGAG